MKHTLSYGTTGAIASLFFTTVFLAATHAGIQSGQVLVKAVNGPVTCSTVESVWRPLKPGMHLARGSVARTGPDATADLILEYNGTVLRLVPGTTLEFAKLDKEQAGEDTVTETSLNLMSGAIVGSQRKLAGPSRLDIRLPGGVATIRGTEYFVRADGAVTVVSGTVTMTYNLPKAGGSVRVAVPAGSSFNPVTGQVVPTTPDYLLSIIGHIDTVRDNAEVFKGGGATVVVKPEQMISPTQPHGNNGVGNGIDPQPPGNPPINDGPGTGPGNPGNRGGAHKPQGS